MSIPRIAPTLLAIALISAAAPEDAHAQDRADAAPLRLIAGAGIVAAAAPVASSGCPDDIRAEPPYYAERTPGSGHTWKPLVSITASIELPFGR